MPSTKPRKTCPRAYDAVATLLSIGINRHDQIFISGTSNPNSNVSAT